MATACSGDLMIEKPKTWPLGDLKKDITTLLRESTYVGKKSALPA